MSVNTCISRFLLPKISFCFTVFTFCILYGDTYKYMKKYIVIIIIIIDVVILYLVLF